MDLTFTFHPGPNALTDLAKARAEAAAAIGGGCAFLAGNGIDQHDEARPDAAGLARILAQVETFDVSSWLEQRRVAAAAKMARFLPNMGMTAEEFQAMTTGEWPGEQEHMAPTLNRNPQVRIARIGVPASWQIPAALGYGGWNDCPDAIAQTALAKRWAALYDADIIAVAHDIIEWEVRKPPRTQKAAMVLAWEQFRLCNDIVDQGVQTVSNLGGSLLNSKYWYFWWD